MKNQKRISVLIDTNLWISFLIGERLLQLKKHIINNVFDILYSDQLIIEIELVTRRPAIATYLVTGDKDLLSLKYHKKTQIISYKEFDLLF